MLPLPITDRAIKILNEALELDPVGFSAFMQSHFPINEALLASDVPLIVGTNDHLGPIGLLNAILDDPTARIAAVVDDDNPDTCVIQTFITVPRRDLPNVR